MSHLHASVAFAALAGVALLGAGRPQAPPDVVDAGPCPAPYREAAPADSAPFFAADLDAAARAYGVPPLRGAGLEAGAREIRLWLFRGLLMGSVLVRVVESDGGVCGEVVRWWEHVDSLPDHTRGGEEPVQVSGHEVMRDAGCRRVHHAEAARRAGDADVIDWCRLHPSVPVEWTRVLAILDSLSVMTLPDVRELGEPRALVHDDFLVEVEVRGDRGYRTYSHGGVVPPPSPAAAKGGGLIGLARSLHTLGSYEREEALEYMESRWRERLVPGSGEEPPEEDRPLPGVDGEGEPR